MPTFILSLKWTEWAAAGSEDTELGVKSMPDTIRARSDCVQIAGRLRTGGRP